MKNYKYKKIKYYLKGINTYLPENFNNVLPRHNKQFLGVNVKTKKHNISRAAYCRWMRMMSYLKENNIEYSMDSVAEIGPGDNFGVGISALLSGAKKYYALDVMKYAYTNSNVELLEELVELFENKASIPNEAEMPKAKPFLKNYKYPNGLFAENGVGSSLSKNVVEKIRKSIKTVIDKDDDLESLINYFVPWDKGDIKKKNSVDFIFSTAVMEHVDDVEKVYGSCNSWLKSGGLMIHSIDFRSHETHPLWNGHFEYSDTEWKIIEGKTSYLINRVPLSKHIELIKKNGFEIVKIEKRIWDNEISKKDLTSRFENLSDSDLTTSWAYIVARKK
jgi:SAM-dependent methyltransferase